tara:strand:- start:549 stop:1031 length:483 start_codon:yes stop_codon:yes gene_type:complete
MVLKYWTVWNFSWAIAEHTKILPYTNSLQASLITTSIMGGYTVYANREGYVIRVGKRKLVLKGIILMLGDFIFHHLPLIVAVRCNKNRNVRGCGRNGIIPVLLWYTYVNYFYNPHKIYNKDIHKLMLSALSIFTFQGLYHHKTRLNIQFPKNFMFDVLRL